MLGIDHFLGGFVLQRIGITITGSPGSGSTSLAKSLASKLGWPFYYSGRAVRVLMTKADQEGSWEAILARKETTLVEEIIEAIEGADVLHQYNVAERYKEFPPELDRIVDRVQMFFLENRDFGIHEGRVAWYLAKLLHGNRAALDKRFIHVLLTVEPLIGAERQSSREGNLGKSIRQILEETDIRLAVELERYRFLYQINDPLDPANFEIVINTTLLTKEEILHTAFQRIETFCPELFN